MSRQITETRMLRYNFTPEEHLENTAEMARLYDQLEELDASHRQIKASLKEEAEALTANLGRHVRLVRDKCDHRKTECRWIYDAPANGQKTLRRNDTEVDVEVRKMEDYEKQESLNLVDAEFGELEAEYGELKGKITVDEEVIEAVNQYVGANAKPEKRTPKFGK